MPTPDVSMKVSSTSVRISPQYIICMYIYCFCFVCTVMLSYMNIVNTTQYKILLFTVKTFKEIRCKAREYTKIREQSKKEQIKYRSELSEMQSWRE